MAREVQDLTTQCPSTYKLIDVCGTYPAALGAGSIEKIGETATENKSHNTGWHSVENSNP